MPKRADYLLRLTRDYPIAVVEAKAEDIPAGNGVQQARDYAQLLGLSFAYATNGHDIIELDLTTGIEHFVNAYPTPDELWWRLRATKELKDLDDESAGRLLTPSFPDLGRPPRFYQQIAINRAVEAIVGGRKRILLTMATGTGKTVVAFQIAFKLWSSRWNRAGAYRRPKILFLADRNILVDDPKDKTFAPFGEARHKIERGMVVKSREMYFATYQSIAKDNARPGLYREYPPDFFDLIIVDEAHRGSARDESNWRAILEYFAPATQLGMTATPLREDNRDTYKYFGMPIYTYSLRQGIEDGFLAPYSVHRIISTWDAAGWRPNAGEVDRHGELIPDDEYHTKDFERVVSLRKRTEAIAAHLTDYLKRTDRFAKTIVFCVDQEHADEMRRALANLNSDLVKQHPDYVARVTSDEGDYGRALLDQFTDPENLTPVILTTSQLLTTGVDAPTVKVVAIARVVGSMTEFKQIIGRGTRVREDHGKLSFAILDYTGSATVHFADPDFDGLPVTATKTTIDDDGNIVTVEDDPEAEVDPEQGEDAEGGTSEPIGMGAGTATPAPGQRRRKYYVDGGQVEIAAQLVYELDPDGNQLRVVTLTDYTGQKVRTLYASGNELRAAWADPDQRAFVIEQLDERGIQLDDLAVALSQPEADALDLLCHLAFNAPLLTRRERAERLRREQTDFFEQYGDEARAILNELLDKYTAHGIEQIVIPDVLKVAPIAEHGTISEIIRLFDGADRLRAAVTQMQTLLYAA